MAPLCVRGAFALGDKHRGVWGKVMVSVVIMPPDLAWNGWDALEPDVTFKLLAVAGTPNTNARGYDLIHQAMDILHLADVNMATATPVGFDLAGAGTLAAYEITLNPM